MGIGLGSEWDRNKKQKEKIVETKHILELFSFFFLLIYLRDSIDVQSFSPCGRSHEVNGTLWIHNNEMNERRKMEWNGYISRTASAVVWAVRSLHKGDNSKRQLAAAAAAAKLEQQ